MVAIAASILILMVEFGVQIFTKWKQSLVEIEQYKSQTMQAKLDNLKHQVNPHFLFNNMSVLTSLIYKDQDKAADFVQQLSKVYRYLLDQTSSELVCLEEEMKFLESYIYLLQIRYSPNLTIENKISANQLKRLIPPFSVQLLLENAIKHNEVSTEKPLLIELSIENEMLIVKNNKNPRISEEESSRKGLKNIQSRYAFFTDKPVEIVDLPRSFIVRIPLLQEE
jgi:LytS/YehU family sensor histidine kinase